MNPVIINADDLGLSREVNAGIFEGLSRGGVSDASLLIHAPFADEAVDGLRQRGISHIGLHINLDVLFGWDISGRERFPRHELMSMLRDRDFLNRCRASACGQIEKLLGTGLIPSHIDSHHHVHGFLPILAIFIELMREYRIPALRHSPAGYTLTTRKPIPYDESEYRAVGERLLQERLFFCRTMVEGAGRLDEIATFPAELVVHPSLGGDPWRTAELEILLSGSFRKVLGERGMQPVSYQDLMGEAQES